VFEKIELILRSTPEDIKRAIEAMVVESSSSQFIKYPDIDVTIDVHDVLNSSKSNGHE
jgi:hypothetical protein